MATPITRAEVLNLIQSKPSTNGAGLAKKGVRRKCNKPGHWSRECKENNNKGKGRNGSKNVRPRDVKSFWKSTPPPSGAPQTKQANGKAFNWCADCKRWTTTHATATHTGGKKGADGANGGGTAINNVSLAFDPLVWTTEIEVAPSVTDALFVLCTAVTRPPGTHCTAHQREGNIFSPVCKNYVDLHAGKFSIRHGVFQCRQLDPSQCNCSSAYHGRSPASVAIFGNPSGGTHCSVALAPNGRHCTVLVA